jgi:glycine cleavage system H protein
MTASYPEDCRYTKEHEWVRAAGDRGTIGITDHAQKALGDVVFVELPEAGQTVEAGQRFGTVESVKAVSELYSPVTGQVLEVHKGLDDTPEVINTDPYGEGWMIVVQLTSPAALEGLMNASQYRAFVDSESK